MTTRREVPALWSTLLERKGISSLRHLARKAGVAPTSVSRMVHGDGDSSDATVRAIAEVLGLELPDMYRLIGDDMPEAAPYVPPAEANRLTARQRQAVDELIRAIAAGREEGGGDASQAEDEAGSDPGVLGVGDRAPMSLAEARRVKADPAAFGDQPRRGDLDVPDYGRMAADDSPSEGRRAADKSRDLGEGPQ